MVIVTYLLIYFTQSQQRKKEIRFMLRLNFRFV